MAGARACGQCSVELALVAVVLGSFLLGFAHLSEIVDRFFAHSYLSREVSR